MLYPLFYIFVSFTLWTMYFFKFTCSQWTYCYHNVLPSGKRQPKSVVEEKTKSYIEYKLILNHEHSSVSMVLLSYNSHTTQLTYCKFNGFYTELTITTVNSGTFSSPQKDTCTFWQSLPFWPLPRKPQIHGLLGLPVLDVSHKHSHSREAFITEPNFLPAKSLRWPTVLTCRCWAVFGQVKGHHRHPVLGPVQWTQYS